VLLNSFLFHTITKLGIPRFTHGKQASVTMETSAGEEDCAATGPPNNEGRKEKEENGDAIPSIFQYLYSLMDCLYILRGNVYLRYLFSVFDRNVFQRAEQVTDNLSLTKSPVVDDGELDGLFLELFV
jgi:hypothetical protein